MSAFSVENPHDGKIFENYTRFQWGVGVGVVTIFMLGLLVPHEFDMELKLVLNSWKQFHLSHSSFQKYSKIYICLNLRAEKNKLCFRNAGILIRAPSSTFFKVVT